MYNPFSLKDKTIFITGASSGIGRSTAIECSKLGASVIITGRDKERLNETFSCLNTGNHIQIAADLTIKEQLEDLIYALPPLDGCVNNAGVGGKLPIAFIKREVIEDIFEINTLVPILITQLLIKKKKLKKGSSIVFTSSISGVFSVDVGNTLYSVTKSAIDGFMKNAAIELAAKGIRVNSVNPGMVETPINNLDSVTKEQKIMDMNSYPLKRYGKPEEIAYGIIYLLSDASLWTTGISLKIDGGYTL
ncbi:MAG: SDR family oxidoreductase [Bacteroidales bacterium]